LPRKPEAVRPATTSGAKIICTSACLAKSRNASLNGCAAMFSATDWLGSPAVAVAQATVIKAKTPTRSLLRGPLELLGFVWLIDAIPLASNSGWSDQLKESRNIRRRYARIPTEMSKKNRPDWFLLAILNVVLTASF
jgi:hypothetical protein